MTKQQHYLREWRKFNKLTQTELADLVGTSTGVISHLETDKRDLSLKWLIRLAPALKTTPGFLVDHNPYDLDTDILEIWATIPDDQQGQAKQVLKAFQKAVS